MKFLLILLISATILLSIAEAASTSKKANTSPVSYRNARKTKYKELVDLMRDEENDQDELDDEEGDDDDDGDDDLDDESDDDDSGVVRFPQFHELFPNPDGRPAGPNSYDAYLKHMPKAQQQGQRQPQQGYSHGHPPPSPVRRVEQGPVYDDDAPPPPPRRRKISKNSRKKSRPSPDYDDSPPPPRGPPPPGYYNDAPPPPQYYNDAPPPPQYYNDAPPPQGQPQYYDDAPSHDQHHKGRPIQHHGPPPSKGQNHDGFQPGYPIVEALPQGGEATSWFEFPSSLSLFGRGRSDLPSFGQQGVLSRRLLSESEEVSSDSSAQVQVQPQGQAPASAQEASPPSKVAQPTLFNRPGHGSSLRPGFGTNRYYSPSTHDTRYFRPITNRIYSDYAYAPQGAFVMNGYRPSYRPRYDTSLEQSPRQFFPFVLPVRGSGARYYSPWSNNRLRDQYNPDYVVNPSEMLSRRKYRYHSAQRVPIARIPMYNGHWGTARNTFMDPWTGSHYHTNYLASKLL